MCDEKKIDSLGRRIDKLLPEIRELDKNLTLTNNNIGHLSGEVVEITKENAKMRETLYGNGNPTGGISGRMSKVEIWIENQVWFQRLLIALIVAEAIGIGIYVIRQALISGS